MQQENRVRSEVPGRTQGHTELGVFSTPPADANTERTKTALKSNKVTNPNTGSAGEHLASSLALFKTKRGSPWSLVSSAQFENIMQDSLHGARRGSESRTKRKRPERFQQNNQLRSRSSAVTHSMEGSIHSSGRIKSLGGGKKEDAELQKAHQERGGRSQRWTPRCERGESAWSLRVLGVPLGCPVCALQTPVSVRCSGAAAGHPGWCSLVCVRGEEPEAFPHFTPRLSCSAEM